MMLECLLLLVLLTCGYLLGYLHGTTLQSEAIRAALSWMKATEERQAQGEDAIRDIECAIGWGSKTDRGEATE